MAIKKGITKGYIRKIKVKTPSGARLIKTVRVGPKQRTFKQLTAASRRRKAR